MEVRVIGNSQEIAALVLALQERQGENLSQTIMNRLQEKLHRTEPVCPL